MVGTMNKSMAAMSGAWLRRKVRHPWRGGTRRLTIREPDAAMRPAPQDNQLMSKHRVLSFKPQLRLEWRGQHGQNETEQPDHSASLGDSITHRRQILWFGVT